MGRPPDGNPDSQLDDESVEQQRRTARIAGGLYLALFVIAPFAYFYVPGELFHDDAATTYAQISADTGLFAAGMIAETVIVGIEVALAGLLWKLFRPVSEALALSSSLARVGEAFIQTVNVLLAGAVLIVVDRGGLSGLTVDQRDEVVGFLVDTIGFGVMVWGLLFGLHLLLLGVLVRRSELMPRWIGSLLLVASVGYLAQSYAHIVDTDLDGFFENLVVVLSVPGELAFAGYLLVRGTRRNRPLPEER
ncbi:DUF4386 domain-containing protein [Ilumatobacter sp.]|uniref:DUF4386 domain-containing protein n=1 Tax=Ilumatobacter sp. TaxID=1967498 RepID=UPI003AF75C95